MKLKSGRVLDDALIEKLASEAERGYNLSLARRVVLKEGRPARGEQMGESPRVTARVPEDVYSAAKRRAEGEGLTVSEVVRTLLTAYASGRPYRKRRQSPDRKMSAIRINEPGRLPTSRGRKGARL